MNTKHFAPHSMLIALLAGTALAGSPYTVTDLGSLGDAAAAADVNSQGLAVGYAVDLLYRYHGFMSDGNAFTQYTPMGPTAQGQSMAINGSGQSLLASYMLGELSSTAFLVTNDMPMNIGDFMPIGMNDVGQVVGSRFVSQPNGMEFEQACRWQAGNLVTLGQLGGGLSSIAKDINDAGWAVGSATRASALTPTASLWMNDAAIDLGTLGGTWSQAMAINELNQVVGLSHNTNGTIHAFRFDVDQAGTVTNRVDLGELGGGYSVANDINDAGDIVGSSDNRAFIWSGGTLVDLNTMIDPASGWMLASATGINANGQIVGVGSLGGDPFRAFLITPATDCPADLDGDGVLDFFDISSFLSAFNSQSPIADWNGDGMFNFFDVSGFLGAFNQGCP